MEATIWGLELPRTGYLLGGPYNKDYRILGSKITIPRI